MVNHPDRSPYNPPDAFAPHGGDEYPGFAVWDDITPPNWEDQGTAPERMPRVMAAKFDSSSREAEIFLHDPLSSLGQAGVNYPDGAYITSLVVNHHRRLDKKIIRVVAVIDDESVGLTIHKEDRADG
jgi:hypothetical protein